MAYNFEEEGEEVLKDYLNDDYFVMYEQDAHIDFTEIDQAVEYEKT